MGPLDLLPVEEAGRFGREPDLNAFVELHNLIAAAESPADFSEGDRDRIGREHGVDLRTAFLAERVGLYARLFDDGVESDGPDPVALGAVARTLALDPADVRTVHERAFGQAVEAALADDCLTVEERLHLYGLQTALGLSPERASALVEAPARERLLRVVARVLCDGELPPEQAAEVARAVEALGVGLDAPLSAMLDAAAARWRLMSAPMPVVQTGVRLADGETAHAVVPARWANTRWDAMQRLFEEGFTSAPTAEQPVPWRRLASPLRTGRIVLTSQRLVLLHTERPSRSVRLAGIREAVAFRDGALVRLDGDARRLLLDLGAETARFCALLERALQAAPDRPEAPASSAVRWKRILDGAYPTSGRAARRYVERVARDPGGWELAGRATVMGAQIVLDNAIGAYVIPTHQILAVVLKEGVVGLRDTSGCGWVLVFERHEDARTACSWMWDRVV